MTRYRVNTCSRNGAPFPIHKWGLIPKGSTNHGRKRATLCFASQSAWDLLKGAAEEMTDLKVCALRERERIRMWLILLRPSEEYWGTVGRLLLSTCVEFCVKFCVHTSVFPSANLKAPPRLLCAWGSNSVPLS